eukprot:3400901-Amphidinium_carterae.2
MVLCRSNVRRADWYTEYYTRRKTRSTLSDTWRQDSETLHQNRQVHGDTNDLLADSPEHHHGQASVLRTSSTTSTTFQSSPATSTWMRSTRRSCLLTTTRTQDRRTSQARESIKATKGRGKTHHKGRLQRRHSIDVSTEGRQSSVIIYYTATIHTFNANAPPVPAIPTINEDTTATMDSGTRPTPRVS